MQLIIKDKTMVIDPRIRKIIEKIQSLNYQVVIVGGYVRNSLLAITSEDYDLATNADLNQLKDIFSYSNEFIFNQEVLMLEIEYEGLKLELSRYRKEIYEGNQLVDAKLVDSFKEDTYRRDFTMNAIGYDNETYLDYHQGRKDLEDRVIRLIGDPKTRFTEDPTRILRAMRFASELNLKIDDKLINYINGNISLILDLDISSELYRIILGDNFKYILEKFEDIFIYLAHDFLSPISSSDQSLIKSKLDLIYYLIFKQNLKLDYLLIKKLNPKNKDIKFIEKYQNIVNELKYRLFYEDIELMFASFGASVMEKIYQDLNGLQIINEYNLNFIEKVSKLGYLKIDQLKVTINDLPSDYTIKVKYEILKNLQKLIIKGFIENDEDQLKEYIDNNY